MEVSFTKTYRFSGILLQIAGITLLLLNVVFTPQVLAIENYVESVTSNAYGWRLGFACLTAALLILASPGIYLFYVQKNGEIMKGILLLVALLLGNCFLLVHEWNQWLFIRELGISFPDTLSQLGDLDRLSLYDLSAIISTSLFFLGWVIATSLLWLSKVLNRYIAILILTGLVVSPVLAALISAVYAGIVSSILLGSGWFLFGKKLYRSV